MSREILLTQGRVAIVDDEDYSFLNRWKWYHGKQGYATRSTLFSDGRKSTLMMHRLIINTPNDMKTDHIDGDKLNNVRINLRICSHSENLRNRSFQYNNTSGYKGVSWNKRDSVWQAHIRIDNKQFHLGYYPIKEEAAIAYNAAAIVLHGNFAYLNEVIGG